MNHRIVIALGALVLSATAVTAQAGGRDSRDDDYRHDGRHGQRGYAQVLVGSQIAQDRGDYRDTRREIVRHCETRHEERGDHQVVAYRVNYVFRGRHDVVRLAYDPGRWLRLDDTRRYG